MTLWIHCIYIFFFFVSKFGVWSAVSRLLLDIVILDLDNKLGLMSNDRMDSGIIKNITLNFFRF